MLLSIKLHWHQKDLAIYLVHCIAAQVRSLVRHCQKDSGLRKRNLPLLPDCTSQLSCVETIERNPETFSQLYKQQLKFGKHVSSELWMILSLCNGKYLSIGLALCQGLWQILSRKQFIQSVQKYMKQRVNVPILQIRILRYKEGKQFDQDPPPNKRQESDFGLRPFVLRALVRNINSIQHFHLY